MHYTVILTQTFGTNYNEKSVYFFKYLELTRIILNYIKIG